MHGSATCWITQINFTTPIVHHDIIHLNRSYSNKPAESSLTNQAPPWALKEEKRKEQLTNHI